MPPFKDEHVLIVAPGSQTTLAQLGLPESYTPARLRIKTRMFPAPKAGEWEPLKIREKKVKRPAAAQPAGGDGGSGGGGEPNGSAEEETLYEEDAASDEGAVWPLREGRIVDWSCFNALLSHVYETLSPPFHTPILLIAQPSWTQQDHEMITQFVFEKFKTPAFALMDHALATIYAYSTGTATVVDVGHEKCDVTAINDFVVSDIGRGVAVPGCGGTHMTRRLQALLAAKGFTDEMSEQLKRSNICEVLPPNTPLPVEKDDAPNPAAAASTGVNGSGAGPKAGAAPNSLPRGPGTGTEVGGDENDDKEAEENEGVLDVASIVTSGKTGEYLARKEKEKAERAAARKEKKDAGEAAKFQKLPNSQRARNVFYFTEQLPPNAAVAEPPAPESAAEPAIEPAAEPVAAPVAVPEPAPPAAPAAEEAAPAQAPTEPPAEPPTEPPTAAPTDPPTQPPTEPTAQEQPAAEAPLADGAASVPSSAIEAPPDAVLPAKKDEKRKPPRETVGTQRREVEVGTERFRAVDEATLELIADSVHRCILSVPETAKRSELWECLIILGNGSKIRGFKDALLATLNSRYLISPSSATIFTSELPSNMTTPAGTGANTPQPQAQPAHHGSGVNPLLLAATTASNPALAAAGGQSPAFAAHAAAQHAQVHSSHGQTPTGIRLARMAEYFPEWKDYGFEEAHFLGAQVAAKIVFIMDQGLSKGFMSRSEYNELGPQGIHEFSL